MAAVVVVAAWLPGLTAAGTLRFWVTAGALPVWVAFAGLAVPRALWPWAALVLWTTAACAWAPWPGAALAVALAQGGWLAAAVLGHHCDPTRLAPWCSVAGALAALISGSFGNPDYAAACLVATVPWTVAAMAQAGPPAGGQRCVQNQRRTAIHRSAHGLSLLIQAVALVGLNSLGAWAGLAVAALAWGMWTGGRWRSLALVGGLAGCAAFAHQEVRDHLAGRAYLARLSLQLVQDHPLAGVGPGGFHTAFLEAQAASEAGPLWTNATHAHNEVLHVVAEQGPLAGLLLGLPLLGLLGGPRRRPAAWAAAVGCCVVGTVSPVLYMPGAAFLAALSLGAALPHRPHLASNPVRRAAQGLGLVLALGALGLASADLLADRLLARADAAGDAALAERSATWALQPARALRLAAWAGVAVDPAHALALAVEADQRAPSVEGSLMRGRAAMAARRYPEAIAAFQRAVALHSGLFAGWYNLARAYDDAGNRADARRASARARALRPGDPRLADLPR